MDEACACKAQMDALQRQLLKTQTRKAQHPPTPLEAPGFGSEGEQLGYLESLLENYVQHRIALAAASRGA
jgi:hypothetical protein